MTAERAILFYAQSLHTLERLDASLWDHLQLGYSLLGAVVSDGATESNTLTERQEREMAELAAEFSAAVARPEGE